MNLFHPFHRIFERSLNHLELKPLVVLNAEICLLSNIRMRVLSSCVQILPCPCRNFRVLVKGGPEWWCQVHFMAIYIYLLYVHMQTYICRVCDYDHVRSVFVAIVFLGCFQQTSVGLVTFWTRSSRDFSCIKSWIEWRMGPHVNWQMNITIITLKISRP